ncbi:MAG: hypothetical protein J7L04_14355 [Bacteroidales bacterium]|nr:hypothetical protein [Bacteroidales bacterium]
MKNQKEKFRRKSLFIIGILILSIVCPALSVRATDNKISTAYEMRLSGKVEEAKVLLEQLIITDSTNAAAYFELARTLHHMMLGGSGQKPVDILPVIKKATEYDPDNVIYAYYLANICFLNAYASKENTNEYVTKACDAFKEVLKLKPDYKEAILSLIEIYGLLPAEMGGNKAVAESYAKSLAGMDKFYAAKANAVLMEEGADKVAYWENMLEQHSKSASVNEELGKAYFFKDEVEKGAIYMEQAVELNPENHLPKLNIARAYVMMIMQNKGDKEKNLELAESAFKTYLDETPDAIIPLKAYAKGWIAKIKRFRGDEEGSKELMAEAKALDPYFSMAFGVPSEYLYSPPDEISTYFTSYFSPF